jgi:hypothetical protein
MAGIEKKVILLFIEISKKKRPLLRMFPEKRANKQDIELFSEFWYRYLLESLVFYTPGGTGFNIHD